jgi:hypothetical protein
MDTVRRYIGAARSSKFNSRFRPVLSEGRIVMLHPSEKIPFIVRAKERFVTGAFIGLTLLVMAGWVYFLGSIFIRFVLWFLS